MRREVTELEEKWIALGRKLAVAITNDARNWQGGPNLWITSDPIHKECWSLAQRFSYEWQEAERGTTKPA
jgi:hypothetical protein